MLKIFAVEPLVSNVQQSQNCPVFWDTVYIHEMNRVNSGNNNTIYFGARERTWCIFLTLRAHVKFYFERTGKAIRWHIHIYPAILFAIYRYECCANGIKTINVFNAQNVHVCRWHFVNVIPAWMFCLEKNCEIRETNENITVCKFYRSCEAVNSSRRRNVHDVREAS